MGNQSVEIIVETKKKIVQGFKKLLNVVLDFVILYNYSINSNENS